MATPDTKSQPYNPKAESGKEAPVLGAGAFEGVEFVRNVWAAKIPIGVKPEHLLQPEFWAHFAYRVSPFDKIEARAEDGTWYCEYIVCDCSRTWVKVKPILGPVFLGTADVAMTEASNQELAAEMAKYKLQHRGSLKWSVIRVADKAVMHEGEQLKEEAQKALEKIAREAAGVPKATAAPATT